MHVTQAKTPTETRTIESKASRQANRERQYTYHNNVLKIESELIIMTTKTKATSIKTADDKKVEAKRKRTVAAVKKAADKKAADKKAADKPKPVLVERDCFANGTTTSAAAINRFFTNAPTDVQQVRFMSETIEASGMKCSVGRVAAHINYLLRNGFIVKAIGGYIATDDGRKLIQSAAKTAKPKTARKPKTVASK